MMVFMCALWLMGGWAVDFAKRERTLRNTGL